MYAKLYQFFWALRDREFRGEMFRYRQEFERNEKLHAEQVQASQWKKLKQLLAHAYQNVPFYRRRFDQIGLHPADINTPADWRHVPILTRSDIQQCLDDMIALNSDKNRLHRNATGGSTGTPMAFYQDQQHLATHQAGKLRFRGWSGFELGDKMAVLWGAGRDIPDRSWAERQRLHLVKRERWLNSFKITTEKMEQFAQELIRWQPKYIVAYASSAYLFASFLQERGWQGRIRPAAIETSADKLWDYRRKVIADVFQCPVLDFYGSREVGCIAGECDRHEGLHVFNDLVYVEVLQNGQPALPGEMGEVIVTNLPNLAMPLIRYQNGDLAQTSAEPCSCGRPFPLLKEIVGRSSDAITTPNGQFIHSGFFSGLFYQMDKVRKFQAYQESLQKVNLKLEIGSELSVDTLQAVHQKIIKHLGPGIEVDIQVVDEIPLTSTGKHRSVISEIPLPFVTTQQR